jgi:CIC family chloride channel protein
LRARTCVVTFGAPNDLKSLRVLDMKLQNIQQHRTRPFGMMAFSLLAVVVGIVAGLGAVTFRALIALIHNALFLRQLSLVYDANQHTPASPWGALVILVPVLGAVCVVFLVKNFAPEAKGHGVPEVMDAIYYGKGLIRPVVALVKSLASALSIGSGGSVGREGPIIQIGSSFGSTIGQLLRVPVWQRNALIACGAGGGIAATFNTPVGGILFAIELMMHEVSVRTLVPLAIATTTATYIGRLSFGPNPSFVIPALETPYFHVTRPLVLLAYVGLGVLAGVVAAVFIRAIYAFEDFFEKRFGGNYYLQHISGMLILGVIMYALSVAFGHYYIEGVGYATVQDVLSGLRMPLYLLLLLFGLKLVATAITLGSGASGGVFSPLLFLGGTLGGIYGVILHQLYPSIEVSSPAFAVAGMAATIGGATGAALAAIVMIFEMTLDYSVVLPMTIAVAISYSVRRMLVQESIYTMKLVRRGHYIPDALHANYHFAKQTTTIMAKPLIVHIEQKTPSDVVTVFTQHPDATCVLTASAGKITGFISRDDVMRVQNRGRPGDRTSELVRTDYVTVAPKATILLTVARLRSTGAFVALVTDKTGVLATDCVEGLITRHELGDALVDTAELYVD